MTTEKRTLSVSGVRVSVVRKAIKNLHLGVYPPDGHVRVAVPRAVTDAAVRVAVIRRLPWIRRQQASFLRQARESERVSGETHYFLGRRCRLEIVAGAEPTRIVLKNRGVLELHVARQKDADDRLRVLARWYRDRLRDLVPPMVAKWEAVLGVKVAEWSIRKMKTKWGSCNSRASRIWLNLELARKPLECLEYVVVHELLHLRVRNHDAHFEALMDRYLPKWRHTRRMLNAEPLAYETWDC